MSPCYRLTKREREVIALVAEGKRNRQIAERLTITEGTVEVHLHNIFQKLDCSTRTEAALLYMTSIGRARTPLRTAGSHNGAPHQGLTEDPARERDISGGWEIRVASSVAVPTQELARQALYGEPAAPNHGPIQRGVQGESRSRRAGSKKI